MTADERNAIIDVLHRVAFGFDQRKLDMVEASFAENATMSMCIADGELIGPFEGRSAIMQLMSDTLSVPWPFATPGWLMRFCSFCRQLSWWC